MDPVVIGVATVIFILAAAALIYFAVYTNRAGGIGSRSMRNLSGQGGARNPAEGGRAGAGPSLMETIGGTREKSLARRDSHLSLRKRLKYGQWTMQPAVFRGLQVVISFVAVVLCSMKFNLVLCAIAAMAGPLVMNGLLNMFVERRFKKFDLDYAQFLMSLVGLLKTGMTSLGAIEAAAQGLEPSSLVRQECEVMVERLRFGVSEEKSIGSFGEDIFHSEIELFVQALLLSRRVGGVLSDTLERLAKQVRKRQYFRNSANAAIGMQRGSIWILLGILGGLEGYIYVMYPDLVLAGMQTETGWQVWQVGITGILLGVYWVRQITKIRV